MDKLEYNRFKQIGFFNLRDDHMWGWYDGIWKGRNRPWIPKWVPQMDKLIDRTMQERRVWWDIEETSYEKVNVTEKRIIHHPGSVPKLDTVELKYHDGTNVNKEFLEQTDTGFILYQKRSVTKEQTFHVVKVIEWIASLEPRFFRFGSTRQTYPEAFFFFWEQVHDSKYIKNYNYPWSMWCA